MRLIRDGNLEMLRGFPIYPPHHAVSYPGQRSFETASVAVVVVVVVVVVLPFHFLCLFVFTITLVTSQKESVQKVLHVVLSHPLKIKATFILVCVST